MALLDELLVGLGFEYNPEDVKQFNKDIDGTVNIIKQLSRVAVAGAAAITGLTIASTAATDEQGKLASQIGGSVENIDALQFALRRAGGTSDGMSNSLKQLSVRASETARGLGSGIEAFGLLGITTTDNNGKLKSTSDLMVEVSSQFKQFSNQQQIELADKLGIGDSILLLQQGPKAIGELIAEAKRLGVTTKEDALIAEEFQDSLTDIWQVTKSLSRTFSKSLAPILLDINNQFTDWWKINRVLIEQDIPKWIDKFTVSLKLLTIGFGIFLSLKVLSHLSSLVSILKAATLSTLAFNVAALILPLLLAGAVLSFIALVEDAKVFFEGGDSFIGDMIDKFPKWGKTISDIAFGFNQILEVILDVWGVLSDIGRFIMDIPDFLLNITGLVNLDTGKLLPSIGNSVSNTANTVIDKMEIIVQGGVDTAENVANAVFNVFQQTSQDLNTAVDQ